MSKEKIVLIIPPCNHLADPLAFPPLGILYIGAILQERKYRVELCDLRDVYDLKRIPKGDFYGVTGTTLESYEVKEIGAYLKGKGVRIVGGVHASVLPTDFVGYYDAIIRGDGEISVLDVIEEGLRGIIQGKVVKDLDTIPFPARNLLPRERIVSKTISEGYGHTKDAFEATTVMTSRSCPFKCAFCANIPQPVRFRSPENVVSEIKELMKTYKIKDFNIIDDHFTMNGKRLESLVSYIKPLNISFRAQGRTDSINDHICKSLKIMGCKWVELGIETADNNLLKLLNKQETVEQHKKAISVLKANKLGTRLYIMSGLPGETWETVEKVKQFVIETQPDHVSMNLFKPFPTCDIFLHPKKYGIRILSKDYRLYSSKEPSVSVIETDKCSAKELTAHFYTLREYFMSNKWRKKKGRKGS